MKKHRIVNHSILKQKIDELQLVGVMDIAKLLNWSAPKVTTYMTRGKLPEPVTEISGRPVWYKPEIITAAEAQNWPIHENNLNWEDPYKQPSKKKVRVTA